MADFQVRHIRGRDEITSASLASARIRLFVFFDVILLNRAAHLWLLSQGYFVKAVFRLLFEISVRGYAIGFIRKTLMLTGAQPTIKAVSSHISTFILEALAGFNDLHWVHLIDQLLQSCWEAFCSNADSLFPDLQSQQLLSVIARIPNALIDTAPSDFCLATTVLSDSEDVDESGPRYGLILTVLDIFQALLCGARPAFQESVVLTHGCLRRLAEALSRIVFGRQIFERLLFLAIEEPSSLSNLPATTQIRNYLALPLLLNATAHLAAQAKLFEFLITLASSSASNHLRLFQADVLNLIIDHLNQYPDYPDLRLSAILSQALHLFSIVSQHVFSLPTLFRCLQAMRPRPNGERLWWTSQLVSLFSTYIEDSVRRSPPAFFYLDGRGTGFELPPIPAPFVRSGWSFMCRCQPHWGDSAFPLLEVRLPVPLLKFNGREHRSAFSTRPPNPRSPGRKLYARNTWPMMTGLISFFRARECCLYQNLEPPISRPSVCVLKLSSTVRLNLSASAAVPNLPPQWQRTLPVSTFSQGV
jgi:hypothetical protein